MDRRYFGFVCGMSEGVGVCVRRDWGERGTWLRIGRHLGGEWGPVGLGCSIHPSARLSRCAPGELGSWGQGLRLGHRHRWSRGCIRAEDWAVEVVVVGSPEWSGLDHISSRHSMVGWR